MPVFIRGQPPDGNGILGDDSDDLDPSDDASWWWSASAETVKWAVIAGIFIVFLVALFGASYHAKRRMKKGLQPLPYHRWLVSRRQRAQFAPAFYGQQNRYHMNPYGAAPPPPYNAEHDYVPPYTPPADGSKIKIKEETTTVSNEGGPSRPPAVANPARPIYS